MNSPGDGVAFQSPLVSPRFADQERLPATPALWSAPVDFSDESRTVTASGGVVVSLGGGTLSARDLRSGRVLWKKGGFGPGLIASERWLAALDREGQAMVADLKTGRERWRRRVAAGPHDLRWFGELLVVSGTLPGGSPGEQAARDQAFEAASGTRRLVSGPGERLEVRTGGLLLGFRFDEGSLRRPGTFSAWDMQTGARRWRVEAGAFLRREGRTLYFQANDPDLRLQAGRGSVPLLSVDAASGRAAARTVPLDIPELSGALNATLGTAVRMDGTCLWVAGHVADTLRILACQRRDGQPGGRRIDLPETYGAARAGWIAGPAAGRLWLTNSQRQVWSARTSGGPVQSYPPHGNLTQLSRFDVTGGRVVVASTDGQLLVYPLDETDQASVALPRSRHITGSRWFGPSMVEGDLLLVQGEKRIEVFRTP